MRGSCWYSSTRLDQRRDDGTRTTRCCERLSDTDGRHARKHETPGGRSAWGGGSSGAGWRGRILSVAAAVRKMVRPRFSESWLCGRASNPAGKLSPQVVQENGTPARPPLPRSPPRPTLALMGLFWLVYEVDGERCVRIEESGALIFARLNAMIDDFGGTSRRGACARPQDGEANPEKDNRSLADARRGGGAA